MASKFIARSFIAYRGASMLDGSPIVGIVTFGSANAKTGAMAQLWIMADTGNGPIADAKAGNDAAVCGNCKHRGKTCYVTLMHGPRATYDAFQRGRYEDLSGNPKAWASRMLGVNLRIGAYGDPAALPLDVIKRLCKGAAGRTGYTHQWRTVDQALSAYVMASADTPDEMQEAVDAGWRTFRIRLPEEALLTRESVCPAADESAAKIKLSCDQCKACAGNESGRRGNIAIVVHGGMKDKAGISSNEKKFRVMRIALAA